MYIISLVFFGFAVRKYTDRYIPAALAMMLWFLFSAMQTRPAELLIPYLPILGIVEKVVFAVMIGLLAWLTILRKHPLRIDWIPLAGTALAAAIRIGWYGYTHWALEHVPEDSYAFVLQLTQIQSWKDFVLQIVLCAVAVWHIYWISRPRFIK